MLYLYVNKKSLKCCRILIHDYATKIGIFQCIDIFLHPLLERQRRRDAETVGLDGSVHWLYSVEWFPKWRLGGSWLAVVEEVCRCSKANWFQFNVTCVCLFQREEISFSGITFQSVWLINTNLLNKYTFISVSLVDSLVPAGPAHSLLCGTLV